MAARRKCGSVSNQYPMDSESSGTTMSKSLSFWNKSQRCVTNFSRPIRGCFVMININEPSFHFTQLSDFFLSLILISIFRAAIGVLTYWWPQMAAKSAVPEI